MANGSGQPRMPGAAADTLQQAMLALNNGRPREAETIAAGVLDTNPRNPQALHILGYALLMQGRARDAVASLEPAARNLHDPEIDTQLAIALRQVGRRDDALSRLKRAVKRRPPFPAAFHELGCLLGSMERDDEAIDVLSRGLEVAPMMPELSVELGYALLRRRDCVRAKTAFARALGIAPNSHDALFGIGEAHQRLGENEAAAGYFRRCLVIKPDNDSAWLNLGHCLLALDRHDDGYACFRAAARDDAKRYGKALTSLAAGGRGRLWLKPSAAARFMRRT
jgi:tetratricopeptide (TPR) repeat protein